MSNHQSAYPGVRCITPVEPVARFGADPERTDSDAGLDGQKKSRAGLYNPSGYGSSGITQDELRINGKGESGFGVSG